MMAVDKKTWLPQLSLSSLALPISSSLISYIYFLAAIFFPSPITFHNFFMARLHALGALQQLEICFQYLVWHGLFLNTLSAISFNFQ